MEDVSSHCVQLKDLPAEITEDAVRACLDATRYRGRYIGVHPHTEKQDDIRWLVRFKTKEYAQRCISAGEWQHNSSLGLLLVRPDYCSECVIPSHWRNSTVVEDGWVIPGVDCVDAAPISEEEDAFDYVHRNRLDSVNSDDLFLSGSKDETLIPDVRDSHKVPREAFKASQSSVEEPTEPAENVRSDLDVTENVTKMFENTTQANATGSFNKDSWHFSGNISVKSAELFGSGEFPVSDKDPAQAADANQNEAGEDQNEAGEAHVEQTEPVKSDNQDAETTDGTVEHVYKNDSASLGQGSATANNPPARPVENPATAAASNPQNPNYDYAHPPQQSYPGYFAMPTGPGVGNPGYMPVMFGGYPPGSMPGSAVPQQFGGYPSGSTPGSAVPQQFGGGMFYPPQVMASQAPGYASQQPILYMPMVMSHEGKLIPMMPGSSSPTVAAMGGAMMQGQGIQGRAPGKSQGDYDEPMSHPYNKVGSGPGKDAGDRKEDPYMYMSRHPKQPSLEPTADLKESLYAKIDDVEIPESTKVEPPALPPRDHPMSPPDQYKGAREPHRTKPTDKDPPSNESGLKIFMETAEQEEKPDSNQGGAKKEEKSGSCKIRVSGFYRSISKDTLELFFESEKRSGGGDIVHVEVKEEGEAIIEFEEPSVVQRILKKQSVSELVLSGTSLQIDLYDPQFDRHRFYLTGMAEKTTWESLQNFFEARCGHSPVTVMKGETPGTALLTFASEPGVKVLQKVCLDRSLEGKSMEVHEVEVSRSVIVTGADDRVSEEALTFYFENKRRSQGGDVESVTRQDRTGAYIVTFRNVEDAERVCKQQEHFINQSNFSVNLYYPCLDLDSSLVFTLPCPIELQDIDTHLKRFLLGNKPYCDDVDAEVSRCHGLVHWPKMTDDCIKISCSVNKNDTDGRQKVENWSTQCMASVTKVLSKLAVDDSFHIAREAWGMFKERLGEISIDDPEKVAVYLKKETHGMVVAGETRIVRDICAQARKLGAELEQQLEAEQQSITKSRRIKRFQIILLTASRFLDIFKKSPVAIEMSHENAEVVFKGTRVAVDEAMEKMCEIIKSFPKKQIPNFRKPAIDLLFAQETRGYIKKKMSQKKVYGVWDVTRDGTLELYSKNQADLEVAANVLTSCMKQKTIPLDSHMQAIAMKPEWTNMLKKLDEGRGNQYKLEVRPGELYIAGIDACFDEIVTEIQGAFDLHSIISDFIEVDAGKFRFIDRYKNTELNDIQKQYLRLEVQVSTFDQVKRKGVQVKGTKNGCQMAVQKIKDLLNNIHMQDCEVKHVYVHQFMASSQGKEALRKIEMYHNCVLEVAAARGSSNAPVEPHPLAKCHLGPVKIAVVEGDMTNMIADAIVNPTNKQLDYKIGLSAAIMAKGGAEVERECGDQRRKAGSRLLEGEVVVTGPGRLSCKHVLHLVTPNWYGGNYGEERSLKKAVEACLEAADKHKCRTLVIPLIGFNKDKFPLSSCVRWLVDALAENLKVAGRFTTLDKVYICDIRAAIVKDVITRMTEILKNKAPLKIVKDDRKGDYGTPMEVDDVDSSDDERGDDDDDDDDDGGAVGGRIEPRTSRSGLQVSVVVGELAKQKADVIVNSTNTDLNLNVGYVSMALLKAGGQSLQDECRQKYPTGVKATEVAVTAGGNLACRYVFHGVLVVWDGGKGKSEKYLKTFVQNCLSEADRKKMATIAFPALGTGNLGYPVDFVAQLMFDTVAEYQQANPRTNLQHVMLAIWQGDAAAIKGFKRVEEREKGQSSYGRAGSSGAGMADTFRERRLRTSNKFKKAFGRLTVEIVQGDITKETSEVIVNSITRDLNLYSGNVSKAIVTAAGQSVQTECNSPSNQSRMAQEGLVVTESGRLIYCKKIIHVESKTSESDWKKVVRRCLELADTTGFASISFPALGTGGKGCSPEAMTRAMFEAFKQFSESSGYRSTLKMVRIVIYQPEMVAKFVAAASPQAKPRKSLNPFKQKKTADQTSVTVYVYADSQTNMRSATRALEGLMSDEEHCYGDSSVLRKLETSKVKALQDRFRKDNIELWVEASRGYIKLRGYSKALASAKPSIARFITGQEKDNLKQQDKQETRSTVAVRLPGHWTTLSPDSPMQVIGLTQYDQDFARVSGRFYQETANAFAILKMERVENPRLYCQYDAKKRKLEKSGGHANEQFLWHASSETSRTMINLMGFSSNTTKTRTNVGDGVLFAVSAQTCAGSCQRDIYGQGHLYLTHVLVGDYCVGRQFIGVPPLKPSGGMYDSTADNLISPSIYVIFDDAQAYPAYHLVFK